jgi:hypothetical protein
MALVWPVIAKLALDNSVSGYAGEGLLSMTAALASTMPRFAKDLVISSLMARVTDAVPSGTVFAVIRTMIASAEIDSTPAYATRPSR